MPRFFFDLLENGTLIEDEEGMLLPDLAVAKHEAAETAAEIGRDRLPEGALPSVTVDVRDENGDSLLSVTVSLTVTQPAQQSGDKGRSRSHDMGQRAGPS